MTRLLPLSCSIFFMFYGNVVVLYGSRAIAGFFVACVENRLDSRRGRDDCAVMP